MSKSNGNGTNGKPKVGAPTKYTPERVDVIYEALRNWLSLADAATMAGISYDTLNEWSKAKPEFYEGIQRAKVEAKNRAIESIRVAAGKGEWKAALEFLARRHHKEWSKQDKVAIQGDITSTVEVVKAGMDSLSKRFSHAEFDLS